MCLVTEEEMKRNRSHADNDEAGSYERVHWVYNIILSGFLIYTVIRNKV